MGKVVGVGSFIVDITGYAAHLPVGGETTLGSSLKLGPGGKGSNQITAAKRAGAEVKIISRVGQDSLAEIMLSHYRNEGMSTEYVGVDDSAETGSALIEVDTTTAENRIIVVPGANNNITVDDVRAAEQDIATSDIVITQLETSMDSILECKRLALKHGRKMIINPAPFQQIPDGLFEGVDIVTPNETEAEFFTGISVADQSGAEAAAQKLIDMGAKAAVITLGKAGAFYYDGKNSMMIPGIAVKAVDTTGAGDAFNGGLAAALAEGLPIDTALKFANCVGALSVTKRGTAPSMPQRADILAMLSSAYGITL